MAPPDARGLRHPRGAPLVARVSNRQHVDAQIRKYWHQIRVAQRGPRIVVALGWNRIGVEVEGEGDTLPEAILALNRELVRVSQTKRKQPPKLLANILRKQQQAREATLCKRGHPLMKRPGDKQRRCRVCINDAAKRYRVRRKIAQDKAARGLTTTPQKHSFPSVSAPGRILNRGLVDAEQVPPGPC